MPGASVVHPRTPPSSSPLPEPAQNPGTKYCSDPDHHTTADCVAAMRKRTEPVNGSQLCALVAVRNSVLAFRRIMRWHDLSYSSSQPPPEHAAAHEIWLKFEKLMNGCVDHICEHLEDRELMEVVGVYVDFADPLRASLALAIRLYEEARLTAIGSAELNRQLRRQLADDPVLKYIFEQSAGRY